jgi:hypothetical protein
MAGPDLIADQALILTSQWQRETPQQIANRLLWRDQEIAFLAKRGIVVKPAPTLDEILSDLELLDAGASQTTLARCSSQVEEG